MTPSKTRRDFLRFGTALAALSVPFAGGGALAATPSAGSSLSGGWTSYEWPLPWVPASADDVVAVDVPVDGIVITDKGSPDKLLLLVAPVEPITGPIVARSLRYRGVVLIGARFNKIGGGEKIAPSGRALPGGHVLQISFDGRPEAGRPTPFVWLSNIRFVATDSYWGDFLQVGTQRTGRYGNADLWCDVYLQRILVTAGHYGWTAPTEDFTPHSDFIQTNLGGIRSLKVADCDIAWGYQTFFAQPGPGELAYADGVFDFRRVVARAMPPSPEVYGRDGRRLVRFLTMVREASDIPAGNYYAHRAADFHVVPQAGTTQPIIRHFSAAGLNCRSRGQTVTWDTVRAANRLNPVWTGEIKVGEPTAPFVRRSDTGPAWRVSNAVALQRLAGLSARRRRPTTAT